ncbi:hypothetical protein BDV95DRAFT_622432 [Massariosphaeria phaeospora]|uniref:Uncharacterized protein n=1 Tax=Massariosphaeria phaeospora TaxID=100035 RepID=A0A7C8I0B8_9PLEO|nr:hypothetical protein BDV95DRAFT_622432 [Massariosphaeria phaeospora]
MERPTEAMEHPTEATLLWRLRKLEQIPPRMLAQWELQVTPSVPVIRIEDWTDDCEGYPITTLYVRGDHELDFELAYKKIIHLKDHRGRGTVKRVPGTRITHSVQRQCNAAFIKRFWECAALLVDYYLDFVDHDSPLMQTVWYDMLEQFQLASRRPHYPRVFEKTCDHAGDFVEAYNKTMELINACLTYQTDPRADVVHSNATLVDDKVLGYLGDYRAGLTPWQQFLYNDSPGFTVPTSSRQYPHDVAQASGTVPPDDTPQSSQAAQSKDTTCVQHVPTGGLAIIQRHTERIRALTLKVAQESEDDRSEAEILSEFDHQSLKVEQPHSYTSLDGNQVHIQPMHPTRQGGMTPIRGAGVEDADLKAKEPTLNMLDEAVGKLRRMEPFSYPIGNVSFPVVSVTTSGTSKAKGDLYKSW